ncbi:SNARE complex subunit (Tlg2), putative [Penicillium digitatum PHI26]|uniref:SNARE complex subunit (Tlg2), putative n=2 Tax=Penicillium digitatum TaxID=36651 RepID=K9FTZ3_PEND2|nr:SNARE complex subunit (Tlg2), putative [Penicillium digitatum Pd1]EKV13105.1 SNARE complex subunit (Tlg2), putative [Penicillium digitatum PHI26]EKV18866.1 SNARE complex subunit (Tlg2), putative [Penicillium digitatum Pd1]
MWRDRTNLYLSYRQSLIHHPAKKPHFTPTNGFSDTPSHPEENRRLISETEEDGDMVIEMDLLPPRWVDVQEEVSELLSEIAQKSAQLDKLHQKHLLPGFGDEELRKKDEGVIERLTQDVTRSFHDCQRSIMRIETMVGESKAHGGVTSGEETMAKNIQISLAARVQEASARFRKKQSTYLRSMGPLFLFVFLFLFLFSAIRGGSGWFKCANAMVCFCAELRDLEGIATPFDGTPTPLTQNPYTDPSMMESDADRSFSQTMLQETSQRQTGQNDAAIAQREREINDIAKGIIELSDIFRELQSMIIDQGTMLDRIDYNVERMGTEVKAADKELKVATGYQQRTTKRKIMLLLLLVVVGMIILLVVKPKRSRSAPPPPPPPPPPPEDESSNNIRSVFAYRGRRHRLSNRFARDRWMDPDIFR